MSDHMNLKVRIQRIIASGSLGHIEREIGTIVSFQIDPKRDRVHYFGKKRNATEPLRQSLEFYEMHETNETQHEEQHEAQEG